MPLCCSMLTHRKNEVIVRSSEISASRLCCCSTHHHQGIGVSTSQLASSRLTLFAWAGQNSTQSAQSTAMAGSSTTDPVVRAPAFKEQRVWLRVTFNVFGVLFDLFRCAAPHFAFVRSTPVHQSPVLRVLSQAIQAELTALPPPTVENTFSRHAART